MSATKELLAADTAKSIRKDEHTSNSRFSHSDCMDIQDPTGISNEEGELLYGMIRALKPHTIVETGTNIGVSTAYMALACHDNGFGHIDTIEHLDVVASRAIKKLRDVGLSSYVSVFNMEVDAYSPPASIDFMWLDTEFDQRYSEMQRFLPLLTPGGVIGIHDLCELDNPAYKGFPDSLGLMIRVGNLRVMNFMTASGVVFFQKSRGYDSVMRVIGGA